MDVRGRERKRQKMARSGERHPEKIGSFMKEDTISIRVANFQPLAAQA
jgi:hypothetical protein